MEMEYINENLIRVFIESSDLIERGISFFDLMNDQEAVENFFMNILREVDVSNQFENTEAITFQVLPKKNGIDLYISKAQDENGNFHLDALEDILSRDQNEHTVEELLDQVTNPGHKTDSEMDDSEQAKVNAATENKKTHFTKEHLPIAMAFHIFEDFLAFAKDFNDENVLIDFYLYNETYFMLIDVPANDSFEGSIDEVIGMASEFATPSPLSGPFIREHGKCLIQSNAHQVIKKNFNL